MNYFFPEAPVPATAAAAVPEASAFGILLLRFFCCVLLNSDIYDRVS
jgi:hypothetical protein